MASIELSKRLGSVGLAEDTAHLDPTLASHFIMAACSGSCPDAHEGCEMHIYHSSMEYLWVLGCGMKALLGSSLSSSVPT